MKDEIQRISKLVAEGKLSPEDAADLIDAFYESERNEEPEPQAEYVGGAAPPPPPPPSGGSRSRDPLRGIIDQIEKLTKEGADAANWGDVAKHVRESARKGLDALVSGLEDLSKGKVNLTWLGNHETRQISLPLTVPAGKTLKVENACGDVRITGGASSGTATAHATLRGQSTEEAKAKAAAYTLIIEESDHQVVIRQPEVIGLSVDLDIRLVGGAPVEIRTETGDITLTATGAGARIYAKSGEISVVKLNGAIEITTESGDITVGACDVPMLTIENKSGDIEANGVRGNMNIRTASGDIKIEGAGKTIALESVQGNVDVELSEPVTGSLNIRTVNGDTAVSLPDGGDCRVSLSTLRGELECDLPLQDQVATEHRINGRVGAGTGTLDISAITGDIKVELKDNS